MLERVPPGSRVERVTTGRPAVASGLQRLWDRVTGRPSGFDRWWIDGVVDLGGRVGRDADVVLGELVPYASASGVEQLAKRIGRPWVADLHDPWALDEMWVYPSAAHLRADRNRMRRTIGKASAIVMTAPEAVHRVLRAFPELADRPVVSIPMGFDLADFASPPPPRVAKTFRIVHTGTMHTDVGRLLARQRTRRRLLGGMPVPGVEFLTRSHVFLVQALERLVAEDRSLEGVIELHLAGVLTDADREVHASSTLVVEHGYVPHDRSIRLVRSADLLFLPMQNLPRGQRAGLIPAKTYEYLASGTPILGAVPDGDVRDMLAEAGNATICDPDDHSCLTEALGGHLARWRAGDPPASPAAELVARFSRDRVAEEMAEVLDAVVR